MHPVLPLLTPDAFGPAVDLIAVILLALFVYGLQIQFEVPAMLMKRTSLLVPGSVVGVITNVACNAALVPYLGLWGAAWSSVATYSAYSFTTLFLCRKVRPLEYPWRPSLAAAVGMVTSYCLCRFYLFPHTWESSVSSLIPFCAVDSGRFCCLEKTASHGGDRDIGIRNLRRA